MFSAVLLLFLIQAWTLTGPVSSHPYSHHGRRGHHALEADTETLEMLGHSNSWRRYNADMSFQSTETSASQLLSPQRQTVSEKYGNQIEDSENTLRVETFHHDHFNGHEKVNKELVSKRRARRSGRSKRTTSKFTGLVVGASKDTSLKQAVITTLNQVESLIWSSQSQFSKPYLGSSHGASLLLGAFNSEFRTNFHGYAVEAQLRRSNDYSIQDLNSLTTLLILQCLTEATLYGIGNTPALSNMSIAVESLKAFHTHTYSLGSSILTMWPEKLQDKTWVNTPDNILGAQVKDSTTLNQLQQLAKTCTCEPAKSGAQTMAQNPLCMDHFGKQLSELYKDTATPPDFMTSFSNLALGSLLQAKNSGVYKAQSELWLSANSGMETLIDKLKSTVIILPRKVHQASNNASSNSNSTNATIDLNVKSPASNREEIITSTPTAAALISEINSTASFSGGNIGPADRGSRTVRSLERNDTEAPTNAPESNKTTEQVTVKVLPVETDTTAAASIANSNLATVMSLAESTTETSKVTTATTASPTTSETTTSTTTAATTTSTTTAAATPSTTTVATTVSAATLTEKVSQTPTTSTETSFGAGDVNQIISSESYYALRNYINHVLVEEKTEVILIPSWITDDDNTLDNSEDAPNNDGDIWHNGRVFHTYNSVNLMTTATTVHALVLASLAGLVDLQDDLLLQRIVVSSLRLLTWYMSNPQDVATMVALSEFPSRYQLYWVTSRIAFQLNSIQAKTSKMFKFADHVIGPFVAVLRDKMTFSILQSITDYGLGQDGKTRVYIDDFIGVSDLDDKGKIAGSGDDRLFASSMAINALIATWTVQQDNKMLEFVPEITDPVHIAINSLTNYIYGAVTDQSVSNLNAFMSERIKNCKTLPARYPANIITSADGAQISPSEPQNTQRFGVDGFIPKELYQKLLDEHRFGFQTRGGSLEDLNSPTSVYRFWSSPSFTKAIALQAIAQAANIQTESSS